MLRQSRPNEAIGFPGDKGTKDMAKQCLEYGLTPTLDNNWKGIIDDYVCNARKCRRSAISSDLVACHCWRGCFSVDFSQSGAPFIIVVSWRKTRSDWSPQIAAVMFTSAKTIRKLNSL